MPKRPKCICAGKELSRISKLLKTIAESSRLKIICLLTGGELCVCEIMEVLDLPHNLLSHHLKVLTGAGILKMRKSGRFRFFRVNNRTLSAFKREFNLLTGGS